MGLTVHTSAGQYDFAGPFTSTVNLLNQSGVYVITTIANGLHKVIDAGESHDVRSRVENHDRKHLWQNHAVDQLYASALYCGETDRMALEGFVRTTHNPPCGER